MLPVFVAKALSPGWRETRIPLEPVFYRIVIKLAGVEQPGVGLALDDPVIIAKVTRDHRVVESIGFVDCSGKGFREPFEWILPGGKLLDGSKPETESAGFSRFDGEAIDGRGLGAGMGGIDDSGLTLDDVSMEGVLDEVGGIGCSEETFLVGFVLREDPLIG